MLEESSILESQLQNFKKKFYVSLFLKGLLITFGISLLCFIVLATSEFFGQFNSYIRLSFIIFFILFFSILFFKFLYNPLLNLLGLAHNLSDESAAKNIGLYYQTINDKLLNVIQLKSSESPLAVAAYLQKKNLFTTYDFGKAAQINKNKKYIGFIGIPLLIITAISYLMPNFFIVSTQRIYHFDKEFKRDNPFKFYLKNTKKYVLRGESLDINLNVSGLYTPKELFIAIGDKISKLVLNEKNEYLYTIKNLQQNTDFKFITGGYESAIYHVEVVESPSILELNCKIVYPTYLNKSEQTHKNTGNLVVPQGSHIFWQIKSNAINNIYFQVSGKQNLVTNSSLNSSVETYDFDKKIKRSENYTIILQNKNIKELVDSARFQIDCVLDAFPSISMMSIIDSSKFQNIDIAGSISDDYGISKLQLYYEVIDEGGRKIFQNKRNMVFDKNIKDQKYYLNWNIDTLLNNNKHKIKYYIEVGDNDGVNGAKYTRTNMMEISLPLKSMIEDQIDRNDKESLSSLKSMKNNADASQKQIEELENKLKTKSTLSWQDKKEIKDIINEKKNTNNSMILLKDKLEELNNRKKLLENPSPDLEEKLKSLDDILKSLINDDTKKILEQLEKLLNNLANKQEIDKLLKELAQKEENVNADINRMLELFKQMQFDEKLNSSVKKLDELAKKQEELSKNTLDKSNKIDDINKQQEELKKDFEGVKKDLNDLNKLNSELENKKPVSPNNNEKISKIDNLQNNALKSLSKENKKEAAAAEKEAAEKMDALSKDIAEMAKENDSKEQEENIKDLRTILENLVQLSFDQESVLKGFKKTSNSDPTYISLSQQQIKIKSDSKVIVDSLKALSNRVFQIKSFVTRELNNMNGLLEESAEAIKTRRTDYIITKQQFAMSTMNNLALLLDDVLKQMQQQMSQSKKSGSKSCSKPKNKPGNKPGLSEMQKQLGQKASELMKNGKEGKGMSEELARMAAQQELIRRALQQMQKDAEKKGSGKPGNSLDNLIKEMEKNEDDLVNKRLSQQQLNRQQEILTRLLESEKAMEEKELDEKREANSAIQKSISQPNSILKDFISKKENEIELLKTLAPNLNVFYKKESNIYFNSINNVK